jgi:hypothetical protein
MEEKKMKFNSKICTSREQSERLLALGLKKETADMNYTRLSKGDHWTLFIGLPMGYDEIPNEYLLPAWSLHRLIVLNLDTDLPSAYEGIEGQKNIYDEVIDYLEWLIKEGYFNKEYLV